jgi:hypothetical protein
MGVAIPSSGSARQQIVDSTPILSRMSDEQPFYTPNHKPTVPRQPRPREAVWTVRKDHRRGPVNFWTTVVTASKYRS